MKRKLLLLGAILSLFTGVSCNKTPQPEEDPAVVDDYDATITLTDRTVLLKAVEGSTGRLIFSCDHAWTLEIPEDATWLTANKLSGKSSNNAIVTFTAAENTGAARSATCRILSGKSKKKFTVSQEEAVVILSRDDVPDIDKYYKPAEFNYDMLRSDSEWSWCRSRQSEHFFVFWGRGYGSVSPSDLDPSNALYVDIDDLLEKAEEFYRVNIDLLKFADTGHGKSNLDKYKMQIYLLHQTDWLATGGGYDDTIGALWINPSTCHPVGSTIAHEIGHSFQYQVYADAVANGAPNNYSTGWRYGIGQGCGFWEQCAQWQSYQSYAEQAFSTVNFTEFVNNSHRHFTHEHQRYASYFLMWHWASKYGVQEIGELWRTSKKPEDPIQTYQRKHGLSMDALNADLWEYAARCATWDFDAEATNLFEGQLTGVTQSVREFGRGYIGRIGWSGDYDASTGFYTVSPARAPEATGFNLIRLNVPEAGTALSIRFEGMPDAEGFQKVSDPSVAGWNVGFAALLEDDSRVYSDCVRIRTADDIAYTVPEGTKKLWLVVAATPETYLQHLWDEDDTNDEVWPFRVRFEGTDLFGNITFDGTETPSSIVLEHNVTTSASAGYGGSSYALDEDDLVAVARAFVMLPSEIVAALPSDRAKVQTGKVKFAAVQPDGTLSYNYTANGYGFWFGADGSVQGWSAGYLYDEFDIGTWTHQFGVHPDKVSAGSVKPGDTYTIQTALVCGAYTATLKFNVTITD